MSTTSTTTTLPPLAPFTPSLFQTFVPNPATQPLCKELIYGIIKSRQLIYDWIVWAFNEDGTFTTRFRTMLCGITCNNPPGDLLVPDIHTDVAVSFGEKAAGNYRVMYVNGGMRYAPVQQWAIHYSGSRGFRIWHSGGTVIEAPPVGQYTQYLPQSALVSAYLYSFVDFTHSGGEIKMYLADAGLYGDNLDGSPNPTFRLTQL